MKYLALLLILFGTAQAQTPLPPAPAAGWCSDGSNATGYFGVRGCPVTPPPVDPIDPLGMNTITGKYANHACSPLSTSNGQDFGAVFFGTAYPYRPQTSAFFTIPSGKRYSPIIHMPQNPGIERHFLKADPYGGSCQPPLAPNAAPFDWQIVPADSVTLPPTGKCAGTSFAGDRAAIFTINPSNSPATDNPTMCNARFGHNYRPMIDPRITTPQPLILTWY